MKKQIIELIAQAKGTIRNFIDKTPTSCQILISDHSVLEDKLQNIKAMGAHNLQVLSDFDYTLTKEIHPDGGRANSSFAAIQDSSILNEEVRQFTKNLYQRYAPIERDPTMTMEEKYKHMELWWNENLRSFAQLAFTKDDYAKMVLESRLIFRDGIQELMGLTHKNQIPLYIVSGGLVEVIEASF